MKDYKVDEVLQQIYDIDNKSQEIDKKLSEIEKEYYQKLIGKMKLLERKYMKSARQESKKKSKEILTETIKEEQRIMESCYLELDRLDNILKNHREELKIKIFDHVFLGK